MVDNNTRSIRVFQIRLAVPTSFGCPEAGQKRITVGDQYRRERETGLHAALVLDCMSSDHSSLETHRDTQALET